MIIRVQAPDGLTAFSHQGHKIDFDGAGVAMIDERHFGDFEAHGFRVVVDEIPPTQIQSSIVLPTVLAADEVPPDLRQVALRRDLVLIRRLAALPTAMLEELVAEAEAKLSGTVADADADGRDSEQSAEPPAVALDAPASNRLTDEQIDGMTKVGMVTWLKARDVPVATSSDLDTLRAKVRHANGG